MVHLQLPVKQTITRRWGSVTDVVQVVFLYVGQLTALSVKHLTLEAVLAFVLRASHGC